MNTIDKKVRKLLPATMAWYAKHEGVPVEELMKEVDQYYALLCAHQQYPAERKAFRAARARATIPDERHRKNGYAERGMAQEWLDRFGFLSFMESVGPMPSYEKINGHYKWTLDRIDNDRGYEPGNCRWATYTQQIRNRSNSRWVELDGERLPLAEALKRCKVSEPTYSARRRHGWSEQEALLTPVKSCKRTKED